MSVRSCANLEVVFRVMKTYKLIQNPENSLFGIQDENGKEVFPCIYSEIDYENVYDGIFVKAAKPSQDISLWGVLRLDTAKEVIPPINDWVSEIYEGARVRLSRTKGPRTIRNWVYLNNL